jgi:hypothetical protein
MAWSFGGCLYDNENKKLDDVEEQSDLEMNGAEMHERILLLDMDYRSV